MSQFNFFFKYIKHYKSIYAHFKCLSTELKTVMPVQIRDSGNTEQL